MEVCGYVMTNNTYSQFRFKCIYCTIESELKDWEHFIFHVRTSHYVEDETGNIKSELEEANHRQPFALCTDEMDEADEEVEAGASVTEVDTGKGGDNEEFVNSIIEEEPNDEMDMEFLDEESDWEVFSNPKKDQAVAETDKLVEESEALIAQEEAANDEASGSDGDVHQVLGLRNEDEVDWKKSVKPRGRPRKLLKEGQVSRLKVTFIRRNARVLHLIETYKEHPCLWNPSDENYGNEEARTEAHQAMIKYLDDKANLLLTESELIKTLKQLHSQYRLAAKKAGEDQLVGFAARYYAKCEFLSSSPCSTLTEEEEDDESEEETGGDVIKLNFKKKNDITTSFIESYANFPELYDPTCLDFGCLDARTRAYQKMTEEISSSLGQVNETDVYLAVGKLRKWAYVGLRRLKSKELIKALCKQELQYLSACSFLPPKAEGQILYCDHCNKRFHGDYGLRTHLFKQHNVGDLPYLCSYCPRRFDRGHDMERHKQRAHYEKTLECEFCDMTFALQNDLNVHRGIHTGEKPYVCEICGKGFRLKFLLEYHINGVHLNIRPFQCDLCPKSFRKKVELSNHTKAHLSIRDKKCDHCDAKFICHSALSRHRRVKHNCTSKKFAP